MTHDDCEEEHFVQGLLQTLMVGCSNDAFSSNLRQRPYRSGKGERPSSRVCLGCLHKHTPCEVCFFLSRILAETTTAACAGQALTPSSNCHVCCFEVSLIFKLAAVTVLSLSESPECWSQHPAFYSFAVLYTLHQSSCCQLQGTTLCAW